MPVALIDATAGLIVVCVLHYLLVRHAPWLWYPGAGPTKGHGPGPSMTTVGSADDPAVEAPVERFTTIWRELRDETR